MKTKLMLLLTALTLSSSLYAQKPLSYTLTKPGSMTVKFDPKKLQKIPPILLPCKLTNGKDRPYACEFSFDKLEFYGNDGSLLGTVKPAKGQPAITQLPFNKAKKSAPAGQGGLITYTVKAYFTRRNTPTFPVNKGYQIRTCKVTACLPSDDISTVVSGITMPAGINDQAIQTFDLSWIYSKKDGLMIGPHEVYLENDVTSAKMGASVQTPIRDRAEAWIDIRPAITGDPSN